MSTTDVPDWSNPITLIPSGSALTDLPDWTVGIVQAPNTPVVFAGGGLGIYGDASSGSGTFDGTTTVAGLVPAAGVYTLTADLFIGPSTINNGVTINVRGCRLFCQGTLTNNGLITHIPNNANGSNGGAGAPSATSTLGTTFPATAGGNGAVNAVGGAGGTSNGNTFGGQGGTGGAGGGHAGGAGGTLSAKQTQYGQLHAVPWAVIGQMNQNAAAAWTVLGWGTGGGAGGGDTVGAGGGGGGGGGALLLSVTTFAGTGSINVRGGNGGSPTAGTNVGGGGGGGGGWLSIVSSSVASGAIIGQTIDANGGQGGAGRGTGATGSNGNAGTVFLVPN